MKPPVFGTSPKQRRGRQDLPSSYFPSCLARGEHSKQGLRSLFHTPTTFCASLPHEARGAGRPPGSGARSRRQAGRAVPGGAGAKARSSAALQRGPRGQAAPWPRGPALREAGAGGAGAGELPVPALACDAREEPSRAERSSPAPQPGTEAQWVSGPEPTWGLRAEFGLVWKLCEGEKAGSGVAPGEGAQTTSSRYQSSRVWARQSSGP